MTANGETLEVAKVLEAKLKAEALELYGRYLAQGRSGKAATETLEAIASLEAVRLRLCKQIAEKAQGSTPPGMAEATPAA